MQAWYFIFVASCALAAQDESRAKKQPIVVDAVGNTLPPPSNVPATVGSPINLLTPDRYEFYTFDESGELVKRLMTLEEIQAIVAAGEEAEGLVTLANDNQPTAAFNFSQPPYTVLHSVVTNVQNVLKEQMEAHKKDPMFQPTLDTPDVSDTWSLILPSIFGNTGLDIVPDKTSSGVTTPETETLDFDQSSPEAADSNLSKEGSNKIISSSTTKYDLVLMTMKTPIKEVKTPAPITTTTSTTTTTTTTTTTHKPITTTTHKPTTTTTTTEIPTTVKLSTTTKLTTSQPTRATTVKEIPSTTKRSTVSATTSKPRITTSTTIKPRITTTTTSKPSTTTITTSKPRTTTTTTTTYTTTTIRPRVTNTTRRPVTVSSTTPQTTTTTLKPLTTTVKTVKIIPKVTTSRPATTKKQPSPTSTTQKTNEINLNNTEILTNVVTETSASKKTSVHYEKISSFIPISTASYITEKNTEPTTKSPVKTTEPTTTFTSTTKRSTSTTKKAPNIQPTITTYRPLTINQNVYSPTTQSQDLDKLNATTITTQSVSPSTTATSTEFLSIDNSQLFNTEDKPGLEIFDTNEPIIPIFDVAQSISQIASDLGGNYMPLPTVSNMLDTTKNYDMNLESKEDFEMDMPTDNDSDIKQKNVSDTTSDNFVKISTLDPHSGSNKETVTSDNNVKAVTQTTQKNEVTTPVSDISTIDPILSESMDDLLSQVVNEAPQSIIESNKQTNGVSGNKVTTTEGSIETTTNENIFPSTTSIENTSSMTTTTGFLQTVKYEAIKEQSENNIPAIENKIPESKITENKITEIKITENKIPENDDATKKETVIASTTENQNSRVTEKSNAVEQINNYVQISVSNDETLKKKVPVDNVIAFVSHKMNDSVISTNKKETNIKEGQQVTDLNDIKVSTASAESGVQVTTIQYVEAPNKTESQKEAVKVEVNDKIPELLPKIDDFKKKIQKVNIDDKELANERNNSWKLISTVSPPKSNDIPKDKHKNGGLSSTDVGNKDIVLEFSNENQGLEVTTKDLGEDVAKFTELCNELAFRYWNAIVENIDKRRSFVLSPYSITSMLAMMFMGARGATSGEMNDILKLDEMVTFNPHFTLKNISDSIETSPKSGVITSAFIRELYSDRSKGKILTFYKERAQQFYNGHVEEINFKLISDIIRRRTNMLVKRYTWGKIAEYMKSNSITMHQPLAAFSANIFQTDCTGSSVEGRDGEMYFVVSPNVRQRRLVPVPAVVYRNGFLAGYDPVLDATAAALGNTNSIISTLFVMPGQQGNVVHAEDLETLEQRLLDANPTTPAWNRLLRTLLPRIGLELQIPRFSHKSIFNVSSTLKKMGLKDLFDAEHADLGGLNGPSKDLYLSDLIQSTTFVTCGEGVIGEQHHVEEYPESLEMVARRRSSRWTSDWDEPRDYQRAFHDPHDVGEAMHLPLHLRPRQARLPARNAQPARLKFDRPFLYFVRHNPSGMILYVGRYNPRLLP